MQRQIIRIDESKCDGCGICCEGCPEGALQLIDGKARLVSEITCDGLGACVAQCPVDAIVVETREAAPYDERATLDNIRSYAVDGIRAAMPCPGLCRVEIPWRTFVGGPHSQAGFTHAA